MNKIPNKVKRLALGLLQGIIIYFLIKAEEKDMWPATNLQIFAGLKLIAIIIPTLLVLNTGVMRLKTILAWLLPCTAVLFSLSAYDVYATAVVANFNSHEWFFVPSAALTFCSYVSVFIAQSLILSAELDKRSIASYPRYFDVAWKMAIQLIFSACFLGMFWGVMWMGVALFGLVHIEFLKDLIKHDWFNIPVSTVAFVYAIDLTDVHPSIVRGIRNLKLILLSWLLPLMAAFGSIFILSLPFKGLAVLWGTHHSTQILLGVVAWLILLVNAAYQDGSEEGRPARIIRFSALAGCLLMAPLIALSAYALGLRTQEFGWTIDMIYVAAALLLTAFYAAGYFNAVVRGGGWLKRLEKTNIYSAFFAVGLLIVLFSPLGDPARLSVSSQVHRLHDGKTTADKFDYTYLRQHGGVYGARALEDLRDHAMGDEAEIIKSKSIAALGEKVGFHASFSAAKPVEQPNIVYPLGRKLPKKFTEKWSNAFQYDRASHPLCLTDRTSSCDVFILDAVKDMPQSIIVMPQFGFTSFLFQAKPDGDWDYMGLWQEGATCKSMRQSLKDGHYTLDVTPALQIEINGQKFPITAHKCTD